MTDYHMRSNFSTCSTCFFLKSHIHTRFRAVQPKGANKRSAGNETDWESDMTNVVERLQGKDDTESYKLLLSLAAWSAALRGR